MQLKLVLCIFIIKAIQTKAYFTDGGCYEEFGGTRDVKSLYNASSVEDCRRGCAEKNFTLSSFSEVAKKTPCFCHLDLPPLHKLRTNEYCNSGCNSTGNCREKLHYEVSRTVEDSGCYAFEVNFDSAFEILNFTSNFQDDKTTINPTNMNINLCIDYCSKNKSSSYAGVAGGEYCACGNTSYNLTLLRNYEECNFQCVGECMQICGGFHPTEEHFNARQNVYNTDIQDRDEGCYNKYDNNRKWILKKEIKKLNLSSIQICQERCSARNFTYAGVTLGEWCTCGDEPPPLGGLRPRSECNISCIGDPNLKCGGKFSMMVVNTIQIGGCYNNTLKLFVTKVPLKKVTVEGCIQKCKDDKKLFAGVYNGSDCFCSMKPPTYFNLISHQECDEPCSGNQTQKCGGGAAMNIFRAQIARCKTIGGMKSSLPCVFPFWYKGKQHEECIYDQHNGKEWWCGTMPNQTETINWGYCDTETCPKEKLKKKKNNTNLAEILVSLGGITSLALIFILSCALYKQKRNSKQFREITNQRIKELLEGDISKLNKEFTLNEQTNLIAYNKMYEVGNDTFEIERIIGDGEFGAVYIGITNGKFVGLTENSVAVKKVKDISNSKHVTALIGELKILSCLKVHMNLVNLIGACTNDGINMLLEYCPKGDLKQFLLKNKEAFLSKKVEINEESSGIYESSLLLEWSHSIAKGMEYLASRNIMHGDLAARNVLLSEKLTAKISDFGLSKNITYGCEYRKVDRRMIPWAWMALEYLETGKFNIKSDVWSYGIVLWEMFSLGKKPYGGEVYEEVKTKLKNGYRLEKPERMDELDDTGDIYSHIMEDCWKTKVEDRPNFEQLVQRVEVLMNNEGIRKYNECKNEFQKSSIVRYLKAKEESKHISKDDILKQDRSANIYVANPRQSTEADSSGYINFINTQTRSVDFAKEK